MDEDAVTVEVELPRDTVDALAERGSPAAVLARLADDEARMLDAIATCVEGRDDGDRTAPSASLAEQPPPVGLLVGFEGIEVDSGRAVVALEAGPRHANPMGTLHGGVLCDVGDAAMGVAFASTLDEGESFTTLELDAKFLKPVRDGRLEATGTVVKRGRTVGLVECDVTDEEGSLVARLQSVCIVLRGEQATGR